MTRNEVWILSNEILDKDGLGTTAIGFVGDNPLEPKDDSEGMGCVIKFKSVEAKKTVCADIDFNKWIHNMKPINGCEFVDMPDLYVVRTKNKDKFEAALNYIKAFN